MRNGCEDITRMIHSAIGGTIYRIKTKAGYGAFLPERDGIVTGWSYHDVVVKNGRVYDAMTGANGLAIDEFKRRWKHASIIDFNF